jgi:hypothetical protein
LKHLLGIWEKGIVSFLKIINPTLMAGQIKIKCATEGCNGFVYYAPSDPGIVFNFKVEIEKINTSFLTISQHQEFVRNLVADDRMKVNSLELIYLTCTADPSHTRAYEIAI